MDEFCRLTAVEVAGRIRAREVSPVELLEAVLAEAEWIRPVLNPFALIAFERARAEARRAEQAVVRGRRLGPLHGVPVSIKDLVATEGLATGHGSAIHSGEVPARDAVAVARLRRAGAIVFAKTTTPEFGHKGLTDSPTYGVTRNPWNPQRTPGGSSGGAAVAVACGAGRWRSAPTAPARSAFPPPAAIWWATSRPAAWCRARAPAICSRAIPMPGRSPARSPTPP
jgi:aspartyl-tRNA(Asn)/glutamyl-tRNA(Gln) amidotransferase subunit A